MVTQQEAKDMRDAIRQLEASEETTRISQRNTDMQIGLDWYNTLGIDIQSVTTRNEALTIYRQITTLLETESEFFRRSILEQKKREAEDKFKELKRIGA